MPLTKLQERFLAEYLVDLNGTKAAIRAGYSEASAASTASDLLKKPEIRAVVQTVSATALERAGVTLDRVVTELARIGFANIRDVVQWKGDVLSQIIDEDDPDIVHLTHINDVVLVNSEDLPPSVTAAIAEVSRASLGAIKVKMHPKRQALGDLLRFLKAAQPPQRPAKPTGDADKPGTPAAAPPSVWDEPPPAGTKPN